jgi:type IV pilus assembly protein PilQ
VFDKALSNDNSQNQSLRQRTSPNLNFKVIDSSLQILEVDFNNVPVRHVVEMVGETLDINMFMASPLDDAGNATLKTDSISFDNLLVKLFEPQVHIEPNITSTNEQRRNKPNDVISNNFTFKKEDNIYFFGTEKQLSVRKVEIIRLKHRSVNMMSDPEMMMGGNDIRGNYQVAEQGFRNQLNNGFNNNNLNSRPQNRSYTSNSNNSPTDENIGSILDLIPSEVTEGLDCKVDIELNSIYVTGTGSKIEFFKDFIKKIDKPIPVILIEVMIVEAQVSSTVEAGVSWGIGNEPTTTQGSLFPTTNVTLGAETINRII